MKNINVSVSPHIRAKDTTPRIMLDVCIALFFPLLAGVYTFGVRALAIIIISVATCVLTEFVYQKLMKIPTTVNDFSAVVTGLILAVNLPSTVPLWLPVIGGVFAIVIVKQLFGGIGQNFMNPALAARCFLLISFAGLMTNFPTEINYIFGLPDNLTDAVSGATPLALVKADNVTSWFDMLVNTHSGSIGEASAIAVLIGAFYMIIRKVINVTIPLVYIVSTIGIIALIQALTGNADFLTVDYLVLQLCGGGLLVGAFFMATGFVTSPITPSGKIIYALIFGLMPALIRTVSPSSEGVSYSIIIGNMLTPLIEKYTVPKAFGVKGGKEK